MRLRAEKHALEKWVAKSSSLRLSAVSDFAVRPAQSSSSSVGPGEGHFTLFRIGIMESDVEGNEMENVSLSLSLSMLNQVARLERTTDAVRCVRSRSPPLLHFSVIALEVAARAGESSILELL